MTAPMSVLDLDDAASLEAADFEGGLRSAALGGAQVRATAAAVAEGALDRLTDLRPRSMVLVARSGRAARASALLVATLAGGAGLPLLHVDATPPWVGPLDVVIVSGDDAGDPALLESVDLAARRGAEVIVAVPDEGPMRAAGAGRAARVPPRVVVGDQNTLLRFLAVGIAVLGAVDPTRSGPRLPDLETLADALDAEALRDHPRNEVYHNPAKALASRIHDHRVVFAGDAPATTGLARHASEVLLRTGAVASAAELAAVVAAAPELTAGTAMPPGYDPLFHDEQLDGPRPQQGARIVVLSLTDDRAAVQRRMALLRDADLLTVETEDDTSPQQPQRPGRELERLTTLAVRIEMAAAYLNLLSGPNGRAMSEVTG
ncbi:tobH protein [Skermania sp. ID1734]|uniref:SIS domain-containing protein n=1 Tax=Skermania sp. ID1734 TaxID=2597516 RepID=UPI00117D0465|nr:SIS domain-containing protein [Skermania sp. ID1734]TSD97354.1 tobH protein [Skermania sp. ID1734]